MPLRVETTLLSDTRTLDVDGQSVETLVSQYVAFLTAEEMARVVEVLDGHPGWG